MKTKHSSLVFFVFLTLFFSSQIFAQDFRAALVDYMYVPEGMSGDYVQMEKEVAKPIHQEMINMGKQEAWYLFAIPYPGGTNAEYHYATVRIFSSPEQMESPGNFGAAVEKAHPGGDIEEMMDRVWKTRDLVKTHRLFSWESFTADDLEAPPSIIQVVYFKVPMGKAAAYQQMEREVYHPMHKKEIEKGRRAGWEGWALNAPWGSSQAYTHIAVDMYKDWEQYTSPNIEGLLEEVHPGKTQEEMTEMFTKMVDLINLEEWRLIDYAVKQ